MNLQNVSTADMSNEEAVGALGTEKTLIPQLRKWYAAPSREQMHRVVFNPGEIDGGICALRDVLIAIRGHLTP